MGSESAKRAARKETARSKRKQRGGGEGDKWGQETESATMAVADWYVRWMIRRDMEEVLAIESECFGMHAWTEDEFRQCLQQRNCIGMVAERDQLIAGYMLYELHKTCVHLLNFAVGWQWQRTGCGAAMMNKLKGKLSPHHRTKISCEIRETNLDAQLFFASQGFKATSVIKDLYSENHLRVPCDDDAYVFEYRYTASEKARSR